MGKMQKKGMSNIMMILGVVIVIFAILYLRGGDPLAVGTDSDNVPRTCDSTTSPSWTLDAENEFSKTSVAGNFFYTVNGGVLKSGTIGTAITTLGIDDEIEVIASASNYYNATAKYVVPCKESQTEIISLMAYDTAFNVSSIINSDGVTKNTAAAPQVIAAGTQKRVDLVFDANNEVGGDYILICEANNTEIKSLTSNLGKATVPSYFTVASTSNKAYAFELGQLGDNERKTAYFLIEADDSVTPANDLDCDIVDRDYSFNDDRTVAYGPEDEDGTELGQTKMEFKVNI